MGGYIRMDKDLADDPRVKDLGERLARSHFGLTGEADSWSPQQLLMLGIARDAVIGGLYRLWRHGDTYLGRHDRLKGASPGLARIEEVTALPVSLLKTFPPEWLKQHPDESVELPGYAHKNALINRDERRAGGRKRTAKWRARKRIKDSNGDASHDVTAEASQRHENVTTGTGTGTGTGTVPTVPGSGTETGTPNERASCADAPRSPGAERKSEPLPHLTPQQLQTMAQGLAQKGRDEAAIAATLQPYGATIDQVRAWTQGVSL